MADAQQFQREVNRAQSGIKGLIREGQSLASSQVAQAVSLGAVAAGLSKAFAAADQYEGAQRRLASTAKLTGQNLGFLQKTAYDAQRSFKLSATTANDLTIEITKLTSKAGDVKATGAALGAFLEIGAARGLDATATLTAVRQAILGIDEGTDKLFNANPSVLYADFAKSIGTTAGKLTDAQKAQAILTAAMRDGGKVAGEYAKFLDSPAGKAQMLKKNMEEAGIAIGNSLRAARLAALPALSDIANGLRDFIGKTEVMGANMFVWGTQVELVLRRVAVAAKVLAAPVAQKGAVLANGLGWIAQAEQSVKFAKEAADDVKQQIVEGIDLLTKYDSATTPLDTLTTSANNAASAVAGTVAEVVELTEAVKRFDKFGTPLGGQGAFGDITHNAIDYNTKPMGVMVAQVREVAKQAAYMESSVKAGLSNAFVDFVTGAATAADAFRDFVRSVQQSIARLAADALVQKLLGGFIASIGSRGAGTPTGVDPVPLNTKPQFVQGQVVHVHMANSFHLQSLDPATHATLLEQQTGTIMQLVGDAAATSTGFRSRLQGGR